MNIDTELSETIEYGRDLLARVADFQRELNFRINLHRPRPIWIRDIACFKKFERRVQAELKFLEDLSLGDSDDLETEIRYHKLQSSNIWSLSTTWNVFGSADPSWGLSKGTISLGDSTGVDIVSEYGFRYVKVYKQSFSQLLLEMVRVKHETDSEELLCDEIIDALRCSSVIKRIKKSQKILSSLRNSPLDANQMNFPFLIRPDRLDANKELIFVFVLDDLNDLCSKDLEILNYITKVIAERFECKMKIVQSLDSATITTDKLADAMVKEDQEYFLEQLPSILNLDVTGILGLISDISLKEPSDTLSALEASTKLKSESALKFLTSQIKSEQNHRLLCDIFYQVFRLRPDIKLICSDRVQQRVLDMVDIMGSCAEKKNARKLFASGVGQIPRVEVIELDQEEVDRATSSVTLYDDPQISWILANVFSIASKIDGICTVTANKGIARRISKFGHTILVIQPRSLLGL
ncbi:hypothetical protein V1511DRAFT_510288 [Dipodascopsis uninucleata]